MAKYESFEVFLIAILLLVPLKNKTYAVLLLIGLTSYPIRNAIV